MKKKGKNGPTSPEPGSGGQAAHEPDRSTERREPFRGEGCGPWALWRQDDNGVKFLVCIRKTRQEAEEEQKAFERRHHKQLYFVEPFVR